MSLGVVVKGAEGVVLAADSRVTLQGKHPDTNEILQVNFDNATKLLSFEGPGHNFVAAVTYGAAVIGLRTAHSYLPEFEQRYLKDKKRLKVEEYATLLYQFFTDRWKDAPHDASDVSPMTMIVAGYDPDVAYGQVYLLDIPGRAPEQQSAAQTSFGMTWGGQLEIAARLVQGYDPLMVPLLADELGVTVERVQGALAKLAPKLSFQIPYAVLPLQDCVNLATFLIRATVTTQSLGVGMRAVGGPIDVATITRLEGLKFIQQKAIHGE